MREFEVKTDYGRLHVEIDTRAQFVKIDPEEDDWRAKVEQVNGDQTINLTRYYKGEELKLKVVVGPMKLQSVLKQKLKPLVEMDIRQFKEVVDNPDPDFEHGGTSWKKDRPGGRV